MTEVVTGAVESDGSGATGDVALRPGGPRRRAPDHVTSYLFALAAVITLVFAIPRAMPGDPITASFQDASALSAEARGTLERRYGLDRPLAAQYWHHVTTLARGDLGESISLRTPVRTVLASRLPWTLLLVGTALAISSLISFVAGVTAGWHRGKRSDRLWLLTMTTLQAIPEYALATFLLMGFAIVVPVFPLSGGATPFNYDASLVTRLLDIARHLVLPATALTLSLVATKFLLLRSTLISVLGAEYMVLAEAKGLPERLLKYRHASRNALGPFLSIVGVQAGVAAGATIFVESVFDYPGLASILVPAVEQLDYPLIEGCFLVLALLVLTANLVVDLVLAHLDPRTAS